MCINRGGNPFLSKRLRLKTWRCEFIMKSPIWTPPSQRQGRLCGQVVAASLVAIVPYIHIGIEIDLCQYMHCSCMHWTYVLICIFYTNSMHGFRFFFQKGVAGLGIFFSEGNRERVRTPIIYVNLVSLNFPGGWGWGTIPSRSVHWSCLFNLMILHWFTCFLYVVSWRNPCPFYTRTHETYWYAVTIKA